MTTIAEARSKSNVSPIYLVEITLLGTSPPTLYFSDRNVIISNQMYLDFIDSLDGFGEEIKLLTSDNLNSDITINFKNDAYQGNNYLIELGDTYPFDGASVTIKEVYKLSDNTYSDVETLFVGVIDEPTNISIMGFSCTISDKIISLDEQFNQSYFNRTDYPSLPTKEIGRIVQEIGFGTVDEVSCTGIDVGAVSTLVEVIDNSQTTLEVENGELFPSGDFNIQIGTELIYVTTRTNNTFSGLIRGTNGSINNDHAIKNVFEVKTEYIYHLFNHPIQSITKVFVDEKLQSDGYTVYTGQSGNEHSDYPGEAIISFTTEAFVGKQRNLTYDEAEYNESFVEREIYSNVFSHPIGVKYGTREGSSSILDGGLNSTATSITVIDGSEFPESEFVIKIEDELIYVANRADNDFSNLTRGYAATVAAIHETSTDVIEQIYSIGSLMPQEIQIFGFPIVEYGTIAEQTFVLDLRGLNRKGSDQSNASIYLFAFISIIDSKDGTTKSLEKYSFYNLNGNTIGGSVEIPINGGNWDDYLTVAISGNHWTANDEYTTVEATNVRKLVKYTPITKQYGMTITENRKSYDSILRSDQLQQYGLIASWYFNLSNYTKDYSFIEKNLKRIEQQVDRIIYDKPVGISLGESGKGGLSTRLRTQETTDNNYYYDASTGIEIVYKSTEQDGAIFKQKHSFSTDGETESAVIHMAALNKQTVTRINFSDLGIVDTFHSGCHSHAESNLVLTNGTIVDEDGGIVSGYTNMISVQCGLNGYRVGLKADGTVITNFLNCDTSTWTDIIQISGDPYTKNCILGLKSDGTVLATGIDPNVTGKLDVSSWSDIVQVALNAQVSSDSGHSLGLKSDGTVLAAGGTGYWGAMAVAGVSSWTGIVQVAAGWIFSAGLKSDGTVVASGPISSLRGGTQSMNVNVASWTGIAQIAAAQDVLIGLQTNGSVLLLTTNHKYAVSQATLDAYETNLWSDVIQISRYVVNGGIGLKSDGTFLEFGNTLGDISEWDAFNGRVNSRFPTYYDEEILSVIAYKEHKVTNKSSTTYQLEYDGGSWDDFTVISISPEKYRKSSNIETRSYISIRNPKKEIEYISTDIEESDGGNYDTSGEKTIGLNISATASFIEDDATYTGTDGLLMYRPDYVLKYILKEYLNYTDGEIDSTSFTNAGASYETEGIRLDFVVDFPIGKTSDRFSELLKSLASQARSVLFFKQGKWYLHYLPNTAPDAIKTIDYKETANESFIFNRTPRNEIYNKIRLFYKKNYSKNGTPYDEVYETEDATSITKYGERPIDMELWGVRGTTTAENFADYQLVQRKNPRITTNFTIFHENFDLHEYDTFAISNMIYNGYKFGIESIKRSGKGLLNIIARSWS